MNRRVKPTARAGFTSFLLQYLLWTWYILQGQWMISRNGPCSSVSTTFKCLSPAHLLKMRPTDLTYSTSSSLLFPAERLLKFDHVGNFVEWLSLDVAYLHSTLLTVCALDD